MEILKAMEDRPGRDGGVLRLTWRGSRLIKRKVALVGGGEAEMDDLQSFDRVEERPYFDAAERDRLVETYRGMMELGLA